MTASSFDVPDYESDPLDILIQREAELLDPGGAARRERELQRRRVRWLVCQRHRLDRLVAELSEQQREAFRLRQQGLKYETIVQLTGVPRATLHSRYAAALRKLRAMARKGSRHDEPIDNN